MLMQSILQCSNNRPSGHNETQGVGRMIKKIKFLFFFTFGSQVSEKQYNGHGDYSEFRYLKILRWHLDVDTGTIFKLKSER